MTDTLELVGELSQMRRTLSQETQESLRGESGNFVRRLGRVTWGNGESGSVGGTNISRPSLMIPQSGSRRPGLEVMPPGYSFSVFNIRMPQGNLVALPLRIIGLTDEGTPIIDPEDTESFSIIHVPNGPELITEIHNPGGIVGVDLAFSVDKYDRVDVCGKTTMNSAEYGLFCDIVQEFEARSGPSAS